MLQRAFSYCSYRLKAKGAHSVHSPFVFDIVEKVLDDGREYYAFEEIEELRLDLLDDFTHIIVQDYGAGSKKLKSESRSISKIAKISGIRPKYGRLLFRLANLINARSILELGTCLGIGTAFMAAADGTAQITSIEGSDILAKRARANLRELDLKAEVIHSTFDDALPSMEGPFDMVYIDGNHTYEATMRYFHELLHRLTPTGVMVFDDIYWSTGMMRAWKEICADERITLSIDLYQLGLVFPKPEFEKQHFVLRY